MAKYLLILFAALAICIPASAQKSSFATNYSFMPYQPVLPEEVKPVTIVEAKVTSLERETMEETAKLRIQGREDARLYYKSKGVFWGTMGTTILYPAAGLVTGTVVSVVPPSTATVANPNAHLMKEPAYEEAFKKQAHRKRFGNAAAGFGIGVVVLGVVSKVIVSGL
ncbi:hypothetical protein [Pontibacter pudoricolor]|uniref:hypothetical protein n=1 Tax=Pontibacter pudoricolor TaxID=2694930 RepID=UPI001391C240|nr:hypothetical protein [Pontibacter pudoricolor]